MKLFVEEIKDVPLVQWIVATNTKAIERVRLHLCKYISPAGAFTVEILDADETVLGSRTMTLAEMQALGSDTLQANYYHGQVTFQLDKVLTLKKGVTYGIRLSATGYAYDEDVFLGWVKAVEDPTIPTTDEEEVSSSNCPYDFEFYRFE